MITKQLYTYVIAIDPDVDRSGVAFLEPQTRRLELSSLTFPELWDFLLFTKQRLQSPEESLVVVVEASWLIQGNWHVSAWERRQRSASKGYDVGRNHEVGKKIVELCKHHGIGVVEHLPLKKSWQGRDRKITHDELQYFTGIIGRTNQEERDAALLAWAFADLPIRVKARK